MGQRAGAGNSGRLRQAVAFPIPLDSRDNAAQRATPTGWATLFAALAEASAATSMFTKVGFRPSGPRHE